MRPFTLPEDGCHARGSCGRRVDVRGRMCGKCRGVPVGCPAGSLEQGGVSSGDVLRSGSPLFLLEGHSPSKEEVLKTVQHCGRSL